MKERQNDGQVENSIPPKLRLGGYKKKSRGEGVATLGGGGSNQGLGVCRGGGGSKVGGSG